jgi:Post-segregation antitoxin CcdA
MTVKERITVSIDAGIAAQLKELAGSTSSFVEAAIREKLDRRRNARAMLDRMLREAETADPEGFARAKARAAAMMERHFGGTA